METITRTVTLQTIDCSHCWILYALPIAMWERKFQDGGTFYCPNGHAQYYADSENTKLKKQLAVAQEQANSETEKRRQAENMLTASEAKHRRLIKRTTAGVCPKCHRTFRQVERHMQSKHKEG